MTETYLRIDVFQPPHDDPPKRILLLVLLVQRLRATNCAVQALLILETIDVLRTMGVDILQALRELVIEAVNEADDASPDADYAIFRIRWCALLQFIVIFGDFLHSVGRFFGDNRDKLVDFLLGRQPEIDGHMCGDRRVVIEAR
jgi:hypothetical protein